MYSLLIEKGQRKSRKMAFFSWSQQCSSHARKGNGHVKLSCTKLTLITIILYNNRTTFKFSLFRYPQCLHFLELLQYEHFQRELVNPACAKFIDEQQILHWQYYSRRRMRLNLPKPGQTSSISEAEPSER